jgi:hypothetical protein
MSSLDEERFHTYSTAVDVEECSEQMPNVATTTNSEEFARKDGNVETGNTASVGSMDVQQHQLPQLHPSSQLVLSSLKESNIYR